MQKLSLKFVLLFFMLLSINGYSQVLLVDFTEIVEQHADSVVRIQAETNSRQTEIPARDVPDIFKQYFGNVPFQLELPPRNSQGSGFLVSSDGYVLTNYHVIEGADSIRIILSDQREFQARVVGIDPSTDIAVLKVNGNSLPFITLGNSDNLKVGEWVLAIGTPFGMDFSVTAGIVSGKGRSLGNDAYTPFIQTDVAINPGSSGGPLFNSKGEVIGINSQIYTKDGGYLGLSFAIPSNLVADIYQQIKDQGSVARGWLGVTVDAEYNNNKELAEALGLDRARGALIDKITKDSPADKAGLRAQDIILSYNGVAISSYSDLAPLVGTTRPGTQVVVQLMRNRKIQTKTITIQKFEDKTETQNQSLNQSNIMHIQVRNLSDVERQKLGEGGVFVENVLEGNGKIAGLRNADVITMINGQFVDNYADFVQVLKTLPKGQLFAIRVIRDSSSKFLTMRL